MDILLKNRYFRRECFAETWELTHLVKHIPDKVWCLDYMDNIKDFDIIWKLSKIGDLRNLKKVRKCTYCKIVVDVSIYTRNNRLEYCINHYNRHNDKIIDIALIVSSYYGHLYVVQYLVAQGANICVRNNFALNISAGNNCLPVVRYLVEQGNCSNEQGKMDSALEEASENGHLEMVQYLVEQGADIHIHGNWPLEYAASNNHLKVVQYLVEKGADICDKNNAALLRSVKAHRWSILHYLLKQVANAGKSTTLVFKTILIKVCIVGHMDTVRFLVEQGADIHIQNELPLRTSIKHNHLNVVAYLLEKGADIHAYYEGALRTSIRHKNNEITAFLLEKGASMENIASFTEYKEYKRKKYLHKSNKN